MAYTRPSPAAADLTWVGQSAYTRPVAGAADLAFAVATQVTGFSPVSFGTTGLALTQVGFKPINFGTVVAAVPQFVPVTGFAPVQFGSAGISGSVAVAGFTPVGFGTPSLLPHAAGFKPAHFGIPGMPLGVGTLQPVHFGAATAFIRNSVLAYRVGQFGTPAVATDRVVAVTGFRACHIPHIVPVRFVARTRALHAHTYRLRPVRFGTPHL